MITEMEAQKRGICCFCEDNVAGELTRLQMVNYKHSALCPECWNDFIREDNKFSDKAPVQMGLPLIGKTVSRLEFTPMQFGQMIMTCSGVFEGALITPKLKKEGLCNFEVILASAVHQKKLHEAMR